MDKILDIMFGISQKKFNNRLYYLFLIKNIGMENDDIAIHIYKKMYNSIIDDIRELCEMRDYMCI